MITNKFAKQPLSQNEKEKKAEDFLNFTENKKNSHFVPQKKKESTKTLYLRVPSSYWDNIQTIMANTGLSMNATCLELLRPAIKERLKEFE